MKIAEDMWLRGQAAQANLLHIASYNTAFLGTATLQTLHMTLSMPSAFWSAMSRVGANDAKQGVDRGSELAAEPDAEQTAEIVQMVPAASAAVKAPQRTSSASITELNAPQASAEPAPAAKAKPLPVTTPARLDAPRGGKADDLQLLDGIGPKLETALNDLGIYHFDQIASLDTDAIAALNGKQKGFAMTAERFGLVAQAKARLAS